MDNKRELIEPVMNSEVPGLAGGIGTRFEVKDSKYLNVALESSEKIKLSLRSLSEMITIHLQSEGGAILTKLSIKGLEPCTTYHKYEDSYRNHTAFTTDENGCYTYKQDLAKPHFVFIQPRKSTLFLSDPSGWFYDAGLTMPVPSTIAVYSSVTKTGTLLQNVTDSIEIVNDGITLDGNGFSVTGTGTGNGVLLSGRSGVAVKNITVQNFSGGIVLELSASFNQIVGNTCMNNDFGISITNSSNNEIQANNCSGNNSDGLALLGVLGVSQINTVIGNECSNNTGSGILLLAAFFGGPVNNTIIGNTCSGNNDGIFLEGTTSPVLAVTVNNSIKDNECSGNAGDGIRVIASVNSIITDNTLSANTAAGISFGEFVSGNTVKGNTISQNQTGILINGPDAKFNKVYSNNFIDNNTQANNPGGDLNLFNLQGVIGGNFWNNWTGPDNNHDGFVDLPFVFTGGRDNLPLTRGINAALLLPVYNANFSFLPPISSGASFSLGQPLSVRFQLTDPSGSFFTAAVARLFLQKISSPEPEIAAIPAWANGYGNGNLFIYLEREQYLFILSTRDLSAGTWRLRVAFGDGTSQSVDIVFS